MPLSFPQCKHIPLLKPPLREVICQVRMPSILKIAQEMPAEFQDKIRERFPTTQDEKELLFVSRPGQPQSPEPIGTKLPTYRFLDKDAKRTVSLGVGFYALTTTEYKGWLAFADDLAFVTEAMLSVYKIPYATRIGLRYINVLNTENTKQESFNPDVINLFQENLTSLLHEDAVQNPYLVLTQIRAHQSNGEFTFQAGVIEEDETPAFLLDFDRYIEGQIELQIEAFLERCNDFHAEIYNAFRWCLTSKALKIFRPIEDSTEKRSER